MPEWTASHEPAAHYGEVPGEYQAARTGAALFDLSHRGKLEVSGADAATFLHNLTTNDVKDMPVGAGCEAFHTTPTAKVVDHFYLYHILLHDGRDAFWLDLEPGRAEKLIQALDRYVISEQVEFADRTREFAQFHLAGPRAKGCWKRPSSTTCRNWSRISTWCGRSAPPATATSASTTGWPCPATTSSVCAHWRPTSGAC
jgi:folate-binding Fe-S cluster repair protein YgfZ